MNVNIIVFSGEFIALMLFGLWLLNKNTHDFDDIAAIRGGNKAVLFRWIGSIIALSLAVTAAFVGTYKGQLLHDAIEIALYGLTGIGSVFLGLYKADIILSSGLQNNQAIKDDNRAVAIFEVYIMTSIGIITFAAWAHDGNFMSGLVYYMLGMGIFYLIGIMYRNKADSIAIENYGDSIKAHQKGILMLCFAIILWANIYGPLESNITIFQGVLLFCVYTLPSVLIFTSLSHVLKAANYKSIIRIIITLIIVLIVRFA